MSELFSQKQVQFTNRVDDHIVFQFTGSITIVRVGDIPATHMNLVLSKLDTDVKIKNEKILRDLLSDIKGPQH